MKRVIVSGASSMIGLALINECIKDGVEVLALSRGGSARESFIPKHNLVKKLSCDLSEIKNINVEKFGNYDTFFHLGWAYTDKENRNNPKLQALNIEYTLDAIDMAKKLGCNKFVGAGSQAELGIINKKIGCNAVGFPVIAYGAAKTAAARLGKIYADQQKIEFNWTHILSVYGPHDSEATLVMTLINKLHSGKTCDLTSGEQTWDFLYCDDAARALLAIAEKGINGKTYPIGSGNGRKLKEFIFEIYNIVNNKSASLNFGAVPMNENSVKYLCADIEELKRDTGFRPEVSFKDGIERTLRFIE